MSPISKIYLRSFDLKLVNLGVKVSLRWGQSEALGVSDLTVLGSRALSLSAVFESAVFGDIRNTENMKLRDNNCEDKNSTPKQTKPKVSAVSCTINNAFKLYMCCHNVKDRGIFNAIQVYVDE